MTTVIPGQVLPDVPHLGHAFDLGTEVSLSRSRHDVYVNAAPRTWTHKDERPAVFDWYNFSHPLYLRGDREVTLPRETAREFRWRLRDSAIAAAERSGVSMKPVQDMCRDFGSHEPLLRVGGVVSNSIDIATLPVGTVLYLGHPDVPDHLTVWETSERGMRWLMGPNVDRPGGAAVTIHSMPGISQAPETEEPLTEEEWATIALRAWRVGKTYQARAGWCSVFNNMLSVLDITEQTTAKATGCRVGLGEVVDKETCASLPESTLLWHQWRGSSRFAVYIRDDSKRTRARTRRLFGWGDDGENSHDLMTVIRTPEEPMLWRVTGEQLRAMPDGVEYRRYGYDETSVLDAEAKDRMIAYHSFSVTGWIE